MPRIGARHPDFGLAWSWSWTPEIEDGLAARRLRTRSEKPGAGVHTNAMQCRSGSAETPGWARGRGWAGRRRLEAWERRARARRPGPPRVGRRRSSAPRSRAELCCAELAHSRRAQRLAARLHHLVS